jgi:hypothetical protein
MTREHQGRGIAGRTTLSESWTQPAAQVGKRTLTEGIAYDDQGATTTAKPVGASARADTTRRLVEGSAASAAVTSQPAPVQRSASGLPFLQLKRFADIPPTGAARAVQRRVTSGDAGEQETAAIHASAQRGIATSGSPLPHFDSIQRAFGRHDVSGIQAHTGSEAAASAREMGAQAYATGSHVVLGGRCDLHTVAHEAAHVVQQRSGVQLMGGVGASGDPYERHADAVADAVVSGRPAETLLDQHPGRGEPLVETMIPSGQKDENGLTSKPLDELVNTAPVQRSGEGMDMPGLGGSGGGKPPPRNHLLDRVKETGGKGLSQAGIARSKARKYAIQTATQLIFQKAMETDLGRWPRTPTLR